MNQKKVFKRVFEVNKKLLSMGFDFKEIEHFWNDCFKKSKSTKQLRLKL